MLEKVLVVLLCLCIYIGYIATLAIAVMLLAIALCPGELVKKFPVPRRFRNRLLKWQRSYCHW
jgi:hypothetical protein